MSTGTMTNTWTKKVPSSDGGDFEMPAGGTYPAVLIAMIDLGTQTVTFNGETKDQAKILFVWELTAEHDSKGQTFKVAKDFTFSLNAKAKLRAFLEGWAGRKFADDEEIDLTSYCGQSCMINVTEGLSNAGKRFVDVSSCVKPMRGLTVPPMTTTPFLWNVEGWDPRKEPPIPDWVPPMYGRKVADEVKKSKEWSQLVPF